MNPPDAPIAHEGFFATHFFTVSDLDKSRDFYVRILGGKVIKPDNPCYIKLANTWILLNSGGGPTPDKPEVLLETPSDLNRVSSFLNLRVAGALARWRTWRQKICPLTIPLCGYLSRETDHDPNSSLRPWSPLPRILGRTPLNRNMKHGDRNAGTETWGPVP
jgi:hypothetical protein